MIWSPLPFADEAPAYVAYAYSYPHKSSYGPLDPPVDLGTLWAGEDRSALFLYIHLPFCEMRCGFCNLFTRTGAGEARIDAYLDALAGHMAAARDYLRGARPARLAIGGGTPTLLETRQLQRLFDDLEHHLGVRPDLAQTSIETSPITATAERLAALAERGVRRVSIGVQSFLDDETDSLGRPQRRRAVEEALERIRALPFETLNIDLIYGQPGQTVTSWCHSLDAALAHRPEELFLYPLYVRPGTGLGRVTGLAPEDRRRLELYRAGRDRLLERGYVQTSMRCFTRGDQRPLAEPEYRCQRDGMVGLGAGARSYTRELHYSTPFSVDPGEIAGLIDRWTHAPEADARFARHGIRLTANERRRRFLIQSLLQAEGLDIDEYRREFGSRPEADEPALTELLERDLAERTTSRLRLTPAGMERSDAIGPALYSPEVRARLEEFTS